MAASTLRRFQSFASARLNGLDGVPLASFRSRTAAFIVDLMLVLVIVIVVGISRTLSHQGQSMVGFMDIRFEPFRNLWDLAILVFYFGLTTFLGRGQTIGKRLFRIRVVSIAHDHLSLWHSIERALGYAASALEAGFGFMQYFIHPNCQTVHDRIAETIVVVEPRRPKRCK